MSDQYGIKLVDVISPDLLFPLLVPDLTSMNSSKPLFQGEEFFLFIHDPISLHNLCSLR